MRWVWFGGARTSRWVWGSALPRYLTIPNPRAARTEARADARAAQHPFGATMASLATGAALATPLERCSGGADEAASAAAAAQRKLIIDRLVAN